MCISEKKKKKIGRGLYVLRKYVRFSMDWLLIGSSRVPWICERVCIFGSNSFFLENQFGERLRWIYWELSIVLGE